MRFPAYFLIFPLIVFAVSFSPVHADFVVPALTQPTFVNLQNLMMKAEVMPPNGGEPITLSDTGTYILPIGTSIPLSYSIDHNSAWPSAPPQAQDDLFKDSVTENDLYMELWEGVPFTSDAHLIQNWNITGSSTGEVSVTFPEEGSYFLISYFPDNFYRNPQLTCSNDSNWQTDCAPSYTLDQMRGYFNSSLDSTSSEPFPYMPDAFGGVAFTITKESAAQRTEGSNVLFIPGTLTSRLYMKNFDGSERDLWEPRSNLDIPELAMDADGKSKQAIYTRDIIDQLYSNDSFYHGALHLALKKDTDVYGSFETFMNTLVSDHIINAWEAYPYDWRYDVRDIVTDGTLIGSATSSPNRIYLQDVVQKLASSSATGKVTIIAHSNGGLIAKALAIDLAKKNKLNLVDRIIMIGTPQFGTPKSITDFLHGDEFTQLGGLVMYSDTVREAEATMPGAYDLIPSPEYFSHTQNPVVTFDTMEPALEFRKAIGAVINSFSQLSDFLSDAFHLDGGAGLYGSTKTPIPLSETLITKAKDTHNELDVWTPPAELSVLAIAGWGQLTPYDETYSGTQGLTCDRTNFFVPIGCSLLPQLQPKQSFSEDGDDTVVTDSGAGNTSNVLYVNLKDISKKAGTKIVHSSLLTASPIQEALKDTLSATAIDSPYITKTKPISDQTPLLIVSAHSPVNLLATDDEGNETGIIPVPELPGIYFEKEDIPGSSVQVIGEEKYLYLPQATHFKVSMTGYDVGTTTIDIEAMNGEGSTTFLQEFPDIVTTASTTATFDISSDESVTSNLPSPLVMIATSTSKTASIYGMGTSVGSNSQRQLPVSSPMSFTISVTKFLEKTIQPVTRIPELIQAIITITSTRKSWIMYSTIFISFLRSPI